MLGCRTEMQPIRHLQRDNVSEGSIACLERKEQRHKAQKKKIRDATTTNKHHLSLCELIDLIHAWRRFVCCLSSRSAACLSAESIRPSISVHRHRVDEACDNKRIRGSQMSPPLVQVRPIESPTPSLALTSKKAQAKCYNYNKGKQLKDLLILPR